MGPDHLSSAEPFGAAWIAAQKREIAAVHQGKRLGDDAVDFLAQRRVLPFDGGDVTRLIVEQHRGNLAPGCAFLLAVQRANEHRQPAALSSRQSQAAQRRPGTAANEAAVQTQETVNPRPKILIERNQERAAVAAISNERQPMGSIGIVEQNVAFAVDVCAGDRREFVRINGPSCAEVWRRRCDDDGGWRMFGTPQGVPVSGAPIRRNCESSTPSDGQDCASRLDKTMSQPRCHVACRDSLHDTLDCGGETLKQILLG